MGGCFSLTGLVSVAFLAYMSHSFWSLAKLYFPPECAKDCLSSSLFGKNPPNELRILLLTSTKAQPVGDADLNFLADIDLSDGGWNTDIDKKVQASAQTKNCVSVCKWPQK